jgi:FkbM family methyltransferase
MATMLKEIQWVLSVALSKFCNRLRYTFLAPFAYQNWWAMFLSKWSRKDITLHLRNGTKYFIRPHTTDLAVINEAAIRNDYLGPGYVRVNRRSVVIDVGANIGDFTIQASRLCPDGIVYAVEPVAQNCVAIQRHIELNGAHNVKLLQFALGAEDGETSIHRGGGASSVYWGDGDLELVRRTTLSNLVRDEGIQTIDLLKLDCEEAEWDILPSAEPVLNQVKQLCMEYHNGKLDSAWLESWLRKHGYQVRTTRGNGWNGMLWAWRDCSNDAPQN